MLVSPETNLKDYTFTKLYFDEIVVLIVKWERTKRGVLLHGVPNGVPLKSFLGQVKCFINMVRHFDVHRPLS